MFESPWHWAVVAIVAFILFFGWKQLPEMSRSLGRSLRILKTEIKGMNEDDKARAEATETQDAARPAQLDSAAPAGRPAQQHAVPRELAKAEVLPTAPARPRPRPTPGR